jgi:hypothetical protein
MRVAAACRWDTQRNCWKGIEKNTSSCGHKTLISARLSKQPGVQKPSSTGSYKSTERRDTDSRYMFCATLQSSSHGNINEEKAHLSIQ